MSARCLFLFAIFGGLFFFGVFNVEAQNNGIPVDKRKVSTEKPKTSVESQETVKIEKPSKFEDEILAEINLIRTKPADYAKILEEMRQYFVSNNLNLPGRKSYRTTEGINTLNEAIEEFKKLNPLESLKISCSAIRASRDHLADLQKTGAFSHFGSNGSSPQERLRLYAAGDFYSSENLVGRNGTARDVVLMMILDDGQTERPHRKNLLNSRFKFAGISNGSNLKNLSVTVINFSDSSADKEICQMK